MRKLLLPLILMLTSCGLLGTYDNVELMIGLQVPVYETNVNFGFHMILKDQAINKIQEGQKTILIETYTEILKWKQEKSHGQ
jgi:hypothetical protein